jgi:hypothetical protein
MAHNATNRTQDLPQVSGLDRGRSLVMGSFVVTGAADLRLKGDRNGHEAL